MPRLKKRRYFGTDGIRGRVGKAPITPEDMLCLGWAAGKVLSKCGKGEVLIGKDTRESGYLMESALESGLSAAGMDIILTGPLPTPAVAYLTRMSDAAAGIMISASHNPYYDNGVKFFSADGKKLDDGLEIEIESLLDSEISTVEPGAIGKAKRHADPGGMYLSHCRQLTSSDLNLGGLKIILDCAHGAAYAVGPELLSRLGADAFCTGVAPDGQNINQGCGSTCPQHVAALVKEHDADIGIAFDGDADRVILADKTGAIVDGDGILFVLSQFRLRAGTMTGGVVGTVMSNIGLEIACRRSGIPFQRSAVGDRFVLEKLYKNNWTLGGEPSGHIIQLTKSTTGDGLLAALSVLEIMTVNNRTLKELLSDMESYPQSVVNVVLEEGSLPADQLVSTDEVSSAVREVESILGSDGRVVLRPSGTEPVIRVMIEGKDESQVAALAEDLSSVVRTMAKNGKDQA